MCIRTILISYELNEKHLPIVLNVSHSVLNTQETAISVDTTNNISS